MKVTIYWSPGDDQINADEPDGLDIEFSGREYSDFISNIEVDTADGLYINNSGQNFSVVSNYGAITISGNVSEIESSNQNDIILVQIIGKI